MTTHPTTPIGPDGEEPLSDLFSEIRDLAEQVSSHISDGEVETRLRRVMRRAGQRGPAGADNAPLSIPFDTAPPKVFFRNSALMRPSREIHETMQAIARAQCELTAAGMEIRQTIELARTAYAEAEKARAEAATVYANATKVMSDAQAYRDAALNSAAAIVKEAKAAAKEIRQACADATQVMSDTQTYHDAALDDLRSMTREAKAVVEEIKLAAREMTDQRTPYHAEQQTSVSLGTITCTVRSAVPVEGVSRWVNAPGMLPGRAVWLQARHNLPWLLAMHADNAPQSPTENNTAPQSLAVDNSFSGSDLTPTSEGRIFICEDQYNFGPKIFRMRVGDIFDYGTQDPSRNPADLSQPQPTRNN